MYTLSKNGAALVVLFLSFLGLEATEEGVGAVISAVFTIISFSVMLWNQINRPEVKGIVLKEKE